MALRDPGIAVFGRPYIVELFACKRLDRLTGRFSNDKNALALNVTAGLGGMTVHKTGAV